jgi:hypothetical protein
MQGQSREIVVRTVLGLTGLVALFTGANFAFGGILTLGLEGPRDYVQVADPAWFAFYDSHMRYVAGLWFGMGLLFIASAVQLDRMRPAVMAALALMTVGGLSRLSAPDLSILANPLVGGPFLAEILLMPLLLWRVWLGGQARAAA